MGVSFQHRAKTGLAPGHQIREDAGIKVSAESTPNPAMP